MGHCSFPIFEIFEIAVHLTFEVPPLLQQITLDPLTLFDPSLDVFLVFRMYTGTEYSRAPPAPPRHILDIRAHITLAYPGAGFPSRTPDTVPLWLDETTKVYCRK
jgi:hypothetical protein